MRLLYSTALFALTAASTCGCTQGQSAPEIAFKPTTSHSIQQLPNDVIGQKIVKAARSQLGTNYTQDYFSLSYPSGDPPRNVGACTDVIIRSLRSVGYDLQSLIHNDMARHFNLYPHQWGLTRTDKNIDHRRVPNQRKYFSRFAQSLTTKASANTYNQWRAGDIVYWKLPGSELDHTGIISDQRVNNRPLVIHNLGGCREEDVLTQFRIVDHFRFPKR